jgi:hypothetical protein
MVELGFMRSVQYVVDKQGKPAAVQMDIAAWEQLLNWIEEMEDRAMIREELPRLRAGPYASGGLPWRQVRDDGVGAGDPQTSAL